MRPILSILMALIALAGLGACGPGQEEKMAAERAAQLTALEEAKSGLEASRQELTDLEMQLAELDDEEEGAEERRGELEAAITTQEGEVENQSDQFNSAVVDFINADPPLEGEPLSETQLAAIRLKSAEDMIVAQEHIDKGGDYRRAIDIYHQALTVDPENPEVQAALAEAEAKRYMSEERFAQVRKGMTQDEIREMLGQANLRNVKEYPDRNVIAWFFPVNEAGDAAAVWFREGKSGVLEVYESKYEAIKRGEVGE